jgi:phage terminase large subunit
MARDRRIDAAARRVERAKSAVTRKAEDIFAQFTPYRDDPATLVRHCWGDVSARRRSDGTPYQTEVLESVAAFPRNVLVSGHGIGKSTIIAWLVIWFLLTRSLSRVVIVCPEYNRQIKAVVFAEIRKWVRKSRVALPLEVLAGKVVVQGYGDEWGAIGVPATDPDRIEGFHADHLMLCMDEAKGIPQSVFDALQGALTGGDDARLVITSTPGGTTGPLYRVVTKGGDAWKVTRLSSEDSTNVSPEWIAERAREWGRGSPLYQARVQGKFADAGEGVLFPLELLEAATSRELTLPDDAKVVIGVDVARSIAGDENCVAVARGGKLERLSLWRSPDTMATVTRVLHEVARSNPKRIRVDVGCAGGGVIDRLRQMGYRVEEVPFGGGASDPTRFLNKRAEMFFALRTAMEQGKVALPDDDELIADLSAITYEFDQRGRIKLESKDDVRKRLGRSPDRADAVALALGTVGAAYLGPWKVHRVVI